MSEYRATFTKCTNNDIGACFQNTEVIKRIEPPKMPIAKVRELLPVGKEFTAEFVGKNRHLAPSHRRITQRRVIKQNSHTMESLIVAEDKTIGLTWKGVTAKTDTEDGKTRIFLMDQMGEEFLCLTF